MVRNDTPESMKNEGKFRNALYDARLAADPLNKQRIDNLYDKHKLNQTIKKTEDYHNSKKQILKITNSKPVDSDEACKVMAAMQDDDDKFIKLLGKVIQTADQPNRTMIKETFPEYWSRYL